MTQKLQAEQQSIEIPAIAITRLLPIFAILLMGSGFLCLDALLPLQDLRFYDVLLAHPGSWALLPTYTLFPGRAVALAIPGIHYSGRPSIAGSWIETGLLLGTFLLLFLLYGLALRYLPKYISRRYLLISTLLLGSIALVMPVATSSDVFSYIAYARIGILYHLNPLTTLPTAIHTDIVYPYIYWTDQPSAYGPVWAAITCALQWFVSLSGSVGILRMLMALRLFGLIMHVCSTLLIWLIGGHLQRLTGSLSAEQRMRASLAFAWNPLLLFEACVNAHVDTTLLFFILLSIWFLVRNSRPTMQSYLLAAIMLALATCVKLNIVLFVPGLLLFLYMQRPFKIYRVLAATGAYLGVVILLYAPFWQGRALLDVVLVNPASSRAINSVAEFVSRLYNSAAHVHMVNPSAKTAHTPSEEVTHLMSIGLFILCYAVLCWKARHNPRYISTVPGLIRWMALVWLLYCAVGSPWFWPWYLVTFFGLFALIEATSNGEQWSFYFLRLPLATRILSFSILSLYCFYTWGPLHSFVPLLPEFQWADWRGLWIWALPLLALRLRSKRGMLTVSRPQLPGLPAMQGQKVQVLRK
jgi:hypothetical protein